MKQPSLSEPDSVTVAKILTGAFHGDPFFRWLFPGQSHETCLRKWWEFLSLHSGENPKCALSCDRDESSASIWTKPIHDSIDRDPHDEQNDFIDLMYELVNDRISQVLEAFSEVNANHPQEPHWYLQAVGTIPQMQGKGRAAKLLQPILEICDSEGVGAYLESTNPRNISFYYRLGFEIRKELVLDAGQAALTCMWREPV